jgi:hypothetical protein
MFTLHEHVGSPRAPGFTVSTWVDREHLGWPRAPGFIASTWVHRDHLGSPRAPGFTANTWVHREHLGSPWSPGFTASTWVHREHLGSPPGFCMMLISLGYCFVLCFFMVFVFVMFPVPNVASFSRMFILDCHFGFLYRLCHNITVVVKWHLIYGTWCIFSFNTNKTFICCVDLQIITTSPL